MIQRMDIRFLDVVFGGLLLLAFVLLGYLLYRSMGSSPVARSQAPSLPHKQAPSTTLGQHGSARRYHRV